VARPIQFFRVSAAVCSHTCTVVGAVTISGIGFGLAPYIVRRAPLEREQRDALQKDFRTLVGPPPEPEVREAIAPAQPSWRLTFHDLHRPLFFNAFTLATRAVFSLYADATGAMTPTEFRCALHKMIDITVSWYGARHGVSTEARALAVRRVLGRVADATFRVIDMDNDGSIDACEFTWAVLLVLAVANGKADSASPALHKLEFRVVDASGHGSIREKDLLPWVELALKHHTAPEGAQYQDRGPWGMLNWLFGKRKVSPTELTRKWMRAADANGDGVLSPAEFAELAPSMQVHEVIRKCATKFAI